MGIAAPLADSELFAAARFELRDPPGRVGRRVVRRVHGTEVDRRQPRVRLYAGAVGSEVEVATLAPRAEYAPR